MKVLVRWAQDYGRMGDLDALFVVTKQELEDMRGSTCYLGEALGKHSGVEADLDDTTLTVVTEDQDFIEKLQKYVASEHFPAYISGQDIVGRWNDQREEDNE